MRDFSYTAGPQDEGRKVYHVLRRELALSASLVKRLKNAGAIYLNGAPAFTDVRLKAGDTVSARPDLAERPADLEPEEGAVEVLYETEAYAVVNKPAGVIVHPSMARLRGSLAALVSGYFLRTGGSAVCHVVNRLDRDTSGCVIFAKGAHYKTLLSQALAEDAGKEYLAVNYGLLPSESGIIDEPIRRAEPMKMRRIVSPDGRRAVTEYQRVRQAEAMGESVSLNRFVLRTGRTHQIRVHSAFLGSPVLGDCIYGTEASDALSARLGLTSQLLHARRISFRDPFTGKDVSVEAPINREDFFIIPNLLN